MLTSRMTIRLGIDPALQFQVVILDECSQMVEPLSVVPLLRAKAK